MDTPTKTAATKAGGASKADVLPAFRAMSESDAKETIDKLNAATAEATTLMQDCCSKAVKGAQDYNAKFVEFARANATAAMEFVQRLSSVKSPSEFFELSTSHSRAQFETLSEQAKELTALAQEVTLSTIEPLRASTTRAFSKLS